MRLTPVALTLCSLVAFVGASSPEAPENTLRAQLERERDALTPLVRTHAARHFLDAIVHLPGVGEGREVMYRRASRDAMTLDDFASLAEDDEQREGFERVPVDDTLYYTRLFGTPALYARALDLASSHGLATFDDTRVFDFGFGQAGHLRAMASMGAECVGVEVNPLLEAMYSEPGDTGLIDRHPGAEPGPPGTLRLVYGSWPGTDAVRTEVGGRFDVILSKNVLKRGYIHPEREADPALLIDLGVDDSTFLEAMHDALVPGGLVVIYNYSPAPSEEGETYKPWADGRCPFDEQEWLDAGFEVLAYDVEDTPAAIAHFEGVGTGTAEELEGTLFGMYTVVRKPVH